MIVGPPGDPVAIHGFAVFKQNGRSHAGPGTLHGLQLVGATRGKVEVGHLIVQHESVSGYHDARAPYILDGSGPRHNIAPLVRGHEMGCMAALSAEATFGAEMLVILS